MRDLLKHPFTRKANYTYIGLHRQRCAICGRPAEEQWHICSLGGGTIPVCAECDVKINSSIVNLVDPEHHGELMARYIEHEFPGRRFSKPIDDLITGGTQHG